MRAMIPVIVLVATIPMLTGTAGATGLSIRLTIDTDGTAPFDSSSGPGLDIGARNGILRTIDVASYRLDWSSDGASSNIVITQTLDAAMTFTELPDICVTTGVAPPSSLSADRHTLTCNLGFRLGGAHGSIQTSAILGGVSDGTVTTTTASIATDDSPSLAASAISLIASSAPQLNLLGDIRPQSIGRLTDPVRLDDGYVMVWGVGVLVGGSGKGTEAVTSPFTFDADLSGISPNARLVDFALPARSQRPNPTSTCGPADIVGNIPFGHDPDANVPGGNWLTTNSGTWTCAQSSPGALISVSVAGADTSTSIFPNQDNNGRDLAVDQKYFVAGQVAVFIPMSDILTILGGPYGTFPATFSLAGFDPQGVGGASNFGSGTESTTDNSSTTSINIYSGCCTDSQFRNRYADNYGPIDQPNPQANDFGNHSYIPGLLNEYGQIPSQSDQDYAGDGVVTPGQAIAVLLRAGETVSAPAPQSFVSCAKIDPSVLRLVDSPASTRYVYSVTPQLAITPTPLPLVAGRAAHVLAQHSDTDNTFDGSALTLTEGTDYAIEYGTGSYASLAAQQTSTCNDSDSLDGWFTDPRLVPGGYGAISKMRLRTLRDLDPGDRVAVWFSVAVQPGTPGNWVSFNSAFGTWTGAWSGSASWRTGTYNPTTHDTAGKGWGDRAVLGNATFSIDHRNSPSTLSPPLTLAGQMTAFDIDASVDGPSASGGYPVSNVSIVDTLDAGLRYESANPAPTTIAAGGGGTTVLTWNLGTVTTGTHLPLITVNASVRTGTTPGGQAATAVINGDIYSQPESGRTATAAVFVPGGYSEARANAAAVSATSLPGADVSFDLTYSNSGGSDLGAVDLIDVLPHNTDGRSPATTFHGSLRLASILGSNGETFRYTITPPAAIVVDPADPSNSTTTKWCLVSEFGTSGCPTSLGDSTAIRTTAPAITTGESHALRLVLHTSANQPGDRYTNRFGQRAGNVVFATVSNDASVSVVAPTGTSTIGGAVKGSCSTAKIGLGGITINALWAGADNVFTGIDDVNYAETTTTDGSFTYSNVPSGNYRVSADPTSVPAGCRVMTTPIEVTVAPGANTKVGTITLENVVAPVPPSTPPVGRDAGTPPSQLAFTGTEISLLLVAGMALLGLGCMLFVLTTTRRHSNQRTTR